MRQAFVALVLVVGLAGCESIPLFGGTLTPQEQLAIANQTIITTVEQADNAVDKGLITTTVGCYVAVASEVAGGILDAGWAALFTGADDETIAGYYHQALDALRGLSDTVRAIQEEECL